MFKVGLTGNIASGKSSVATVWQELGATVIDADRLAREAVEPGSAALRRIVETWGVTVLRPDGTLDRAVLRDIVFQDSTARARLESFVHPEVARLRDRELAAAEARGEPIVVADIPLLFEVGMQTEFDLVALVDAPPEVRLHRLIADRGLTETEAKRMIDAQMPASEKRRRADLVIENEATLEELRERANAAWAEIQARAASHG